MFKITWVCPDLRNSGLSGRVNIFVDIAPAYRVFRPGYSCEAGVYEWPVAGLPVHLLHREEPRVFVELVMGSKCRIPVYLHATLSMPSSLIEGKAPAILNPRLGKHEAVVRVESNISANQKQWSVRVGGQSRAYWGELHARFSLFESLECPPIAVYADLVENDTRQQPKPSNRRAEKGDRGRGTAAPKVPPPSSTASATQIAELWF